MTRRKRGAVVLALTVLAIGALEILIADLPLHRALRGEEVVDEKVDIEFDDGSLVSLLVQARPFIGPDGTVAGAICSATVVDDEPTVRMLVAEILADLGYNAIEAEDGASGLRILERDTRIDLLVTDVGLPGGMNGRQLADAARVRRPELKILFITGYAENAVFGNGLLEPGMQVIAKPFAMEVLATRIRVMISGT